MIILPRTYATVPNGSTSEASRALPKSIYRMAADALAVLHGEVRECARLGGAAGQK